MAERAARPGKDAGLAELMAVRCAPSPVAGEVCITGSDPFFRALFRIDDAPERLDAQEIDAQAVTADTCYGTLRTLGPALRMSETPCRWGRPTPQLGGDASEWLPR